MLNIANNPSLCTHAWLRCFSQQVAKQGSSRRLCTLVMQETESADDTNDAVALLFIALSSMQVTAEPMGRIVFEEARGLDGLKEAKITIKPGDKSPFKMFAGPNGEGITLNIAVANGLGSAKKLIKVGGPEQMEVNRVPRYNNPVGQQVAAAGLQDKFVVHMLWFSCINLVADIS